MIMRPFLIFLVIFSFLEELGEGAGKKVVKERQARSSGVGVASEGGGGAAEAGININTHTLELEHSIGSGGVFKHRGTVTFKSSSLSSTLSTLPFTQEPLTGHDLKLLEKAALNNEYYYIRIKSNVTNSDEEVGGEEGGAEKSIDYVMSITSVCGLLKSSLKDRIIIHGDGQGGIISISIMPAKPVLETGLACNEGLSHNSPFFTTTVQYTAGRIGPVPNVQAFLQRQEAEKAKKETEDNRSFFQKYWLYIVIGFVGLQFLLSAGGGAAGGAAGGGS